MKKPTHYSYLSGLNGHRKPVMLLDLSRAGAADRRRLIHVMLDRGELLAAIPWGVQVRSLRQLRRALDWLRPKA